MADFINTIDILGDEVVAGKIVDGSIDEFNDNVVTKIGAGVFSYCSNLLSVNVPNVTVIENNAFEKSGIKNLSAEKVETIGAFVFRDVRLNSSLNFPVLKTIGSRSFTDCGLTGFVAPMLEAVPDNALAYFKGKSLSFPVCKTVGTGGFSYSYISSQPEDSFSSLSLPQVESIGGNACAYCRDLISVTLPATPPSLFSTSAFAGINANCVFHIPAGSLSAYQSATNWAELTGQYTFQEDA